MHVGSVTLATLVCSSLSLVGALFVIGSYVLFPQCRTLPRKLVCFLGVIDALQAIYFWANYWWHSHKQDTDENCVFLSIMGIYVAQAQFVWNPCIAYYLLRFFRRPDSDHAHLFKFFHLFGWGLPAIYSFLLWSYGSQYLYIDDPSTDELGWCYITYHAQFWRLTSITLPLFLSIITTLALYAQAWRRVNELISSVRTDHEREAALPSSLAEMKTKLGLVPWIFISLRIWDAIYRILQFFPDVVDLQYVESWLPFLTAVCLASTGWANCVVFVFLTSRVRELYVNLVCACWGFVPFSTIKNDGAAPLLRPLLRAGSNTASLRPQPDSKFLGNHQGVAMDEDVDSGCESIGSLSFSSSHGMADKIFVNAPNNSAKASPKRNGHQRVAI